MDNFTGRPPEPLTRVVALLSIRPKFAQAILDGTKKVEFRKIRFARRVSHVVIYSSSPVQRAVGVFSVSRMEEATVQTIWARYSSVGGIEKTEFDRYYNGHKNGIVLHVGAVSVFTIPLRLEQIIPGSHPPQSYRYLPSGRITWTTLQVAPPNPSPASNAALVGNVPSGAAQSASNA